MAILRVTDYATVETPIPLGRMTAPGYSDTLQGFHSKYFIIQFTISNINTNVEVEMRGSVDNVRWFNMDAGENSITKTKNGTYALVWTEYMPFMKFWFKDETGGTDAIIDIDVYVGEEH